MEATTASPKRERPGWLLGLLPLVLLAAAIAAFVALDAPGLDRNGVPVEEVSVDRTVLDPGVIEVHLRNDGPDPVEVRQTIVNDGFSTFTQSSEKIDRLGRDVVKIDYPWIEGEAYEVVLLTATGGTIPASIEVAAETPAPNAGFFGLLALIGLYVGVIPVAIGMVWLPWLRRSSRELVRFLLALTVGLLAFLGIDALLEGVEFAGAGAQAFGGAALVWLGAVAAYIGLAGVDSALKKRNVETDGKTKAGTLALLVAVGIGLHNLGEGLAIGSAYAIGSLALGAALIVGFAIHNTTEGLAIVAPVAKEPPSLRRLVVLGLIAGAPVILGAVIGATAFNPSLAALMLGLGAGAIAQVAVQIAPSLRDSDGRLLNGITASGLLAGLALMYVTGLLITV